VGDLNLEIEDFVFWKLFQKMVFLKLLEMKAGLKRISPCLFDYGLQNPIYVKAIKEKNTTSKHQFNWLIH